MSGEVLELFIRLLIVLPIILILMFLVFKFGISRKLAGTDGVKRMRLVEHLPLGTKSVLSIVEVGEKYYLIAHNDRGFELIKELDEIPGSVGEATPPSFSKIFSNLTGGGGKKREG